MILTPENVQSLEPRDSRYIVTDSSKPGFAVKVAPTGAKSYFYRWRAGDKVEEASLGREYDRALSKYLHLSPNSSTPNGGISRHPDSIFLEGSDLPLLVERYLEEHCELVLKPRTTEQYRSCLRDVKEHLKGTPTYFGCTNLQDTRIALKTVLMIYRAQYPTKFNRWKATLSSCFGWGITNDLIAANPIYRIPSAPEKAKTRMLSDAELREWFKVTRGSNYSKNTVDGLYLMLLTGMRPGELIGLYENNYFAEEDALFLEETKNGKPHNIPLSDPARELLRRNLGSGQRLFKLSLYGLSQVCKRATEKAGVTVCTPHDLRCTSATIMGRLGVPTETISRVLNHSLAGVTVRHYALYAHDREKKEALQRLGEHLIGLGMEV